MSAEDNAWSWPSSPPQPSDLNTLVEESGCSRVDSTSRDRSLVELLGGESGHVESVASRAILEGARRAERWSVDSGTLKEDAIRNVQPVDAAPSSCMNLGPRPRRMSQVHFVSQFGHQTMPEDLTLEERKLVLSSLGGRASNSQDLFSKLSSRRFGNAQLVNRSAQLCAAEVVEIAVVVCFQSSDIFFTHLFAVSNLSFDLKVTVGDTVHCLIVSQS